MEQLLPEWLNNEFLTHCLQKEKGKQGIIVTNYTTSHVVPPGNNYCSYIIRVRVEYKNNVQESELHYTSLIIKSEPTHEGMKEMMSSGSLQQSEYAFYYKFLPKVEMLTGTEFAPKGVYSTKDNIIIIEDLKENGFVMADRTKQLDFDHCRLYLEAAASMHAASFAVHKEEPNLIESMVEEKMFSDDGEVSAMLKMRAKIGLNVLADTAIEIERFRKHAKVIKQVAPFLWNILVDIHKPSKFINTINQGDPWTANMMFRYDGSGSVCEVKLIDFQCLRYSSPLNDVVFFIWTSANNYVKSHKLDELYQIYLETFNSKMKQLNCTERLTKEHLRLIMKRLSPLVIFVVTSLYPFMTLPDPVDMEKLLPKHGEKSEEICFNYYREYCKERFFIEQVPISLEQMEKAGVFEHLDSLIKQ